MQLNIDKDHGRSINDMFFQFMKKLKVQYKTGENNDAKLIKFEIRRTKWLKIGIFVNENRFLF